MAKRGTANAAGSTVYIKIEGIFCDHCRKLIWEKLLQHKEIQSCRIRGDIAEVNCLQKPDKGAIIRELEALGYHTEAQWFSDRRLHSRIRLREFLAIAAGMAALFWLLYRVFGYNVFNVIPTIDSSASYRMLLVTGLFTSIHCISMCGAINLTAVYGADRVLSPLLYNGGRVLSYTLIGCAAGALGSIFQVSQMLSGAVIVIASILMLLMSLSMLGVLELPELPCRQYGRGGRNALMIGILNGFMPCGPLQAMQLYALSTGSAWYGGLSMLLFGLGTVPLMTAVGVCISIMKGKWRIRINRIASVLLLFLALSMLDRGLVSMGVDLRSSLHSSGDHEGYQIAAVEDGCQVVKTELEYDSFGDIVVAKDIPVRFIIHADADKITGCNNEVVLSAFDVSQPLSEGDNIICFTPTESGTYSMTCWMGMIHNTIVVVDDAGQLS